MRNAIARTLLLAALVACGGRLHADEPAYVRFMVVLDGRADVAALDALERRATVHHGARIVSRFTDGASLGLLVRIDAARADDLAREPSVASVVRVAPSAGGVAAARGELERASPGTAYPGLYGVVLHDKWGFGLELPPAQQGLQGVARREALRARRDELVRQAAEQVAARYGGAVRSASSYEAPTFTCAMTEEAAQRMVRDEGVWRVYESAYLLIDDPPPHSAPAGTSPAPSPWRP